MGQDESLPILPEDQTELSLVNQKLNQLMNFIPPNHPIRSIDISGNLIRKFPLRLNYIHYLDISSNNLSEVSSMDIEFNFDTLEIIRLSRNNFKQLPKFLKPLKSITNMAIDSNELNEETADFSTFDKLQNLDLFLNLFNTFPKLPESLTTLNIGFNRIRSISYHLQNLTELRISGNEMTEFMDGCFFPNLQILDLSMNRLIGLPPITSFAPNLAKLNCSHNFIVGIASVPPSITHLDVGHNCMEAITFEKMNILNTLDISFNKIKILSSLPPSIEHFNAESNILMSASPIKIDRLNTLQINCNNFTEIPNFKDTNVNNFIMRHNKLNKINSQNISPTVKRIDLTENEIDSIPNDLFELRRIQFLNVSFNHLKEVPQSITGINLTSLFISGNDISDLPELPPCLITLVASHCNFSTIPNSIYKVTRLSSLDLSVNNISSISVLPAIHHINLSMNSLKKLPNIPDNVSSLDLAHNFLKSIELQGDFIMIQDLNLSGNLLESFTAPKLPILHIMKISHNKKLKFSLTFDKFPSLRVLDITSTKIKVSLPLPSSLKELSTSNGNIFETAKSPVIRLYNSPKAGYSEICGARPTMEDTLIIRKNLVPNIDMYAVIDGHAGAETATFAAYYIPLFYPLEQTRTVADLSSTFRKANKKIAEHNVKDGATIALTLISPQEIGIAHLGDARALIVKKDKSVVTLTYDHKPTERSEIDLIKENRSFVDSNRTAGILAVSRSLGDFNIPGISHIPDLSCYKRQNNDYRLVICCDGVFDVIDNVGVGQIVTQVEDVHKAACLLRNMAYAKGSQDNISVIVVDISIGK